MLPFVRMRLVFCLLLGLLQRGSSFLGTDGRLVPKLLKVQVPRQPPCHTVAFAASRWSAAQRPLVGSGQKLHAAPLQSGLPASLPASSNPLEGKPWKTLACGSAPQRVQVLLAGSQTRVWGSLVEKEQPQCRKLSFCPQPTSKAR